MVQMNHLMQIYSCDKPTMHIYKYVQSYIIMLQQHVAITSVTIIKMSYNENTINI